MAIQSRNPRPLRVALAAGIAATLLAANCGTANPPSPRANPSSQSSGGFRSGDCNMVTDAEVTKAVDSPVTFSKVLVSDAGCFWQENTMIGRVGAGMGISTWWYRGSEMGTERTLEQRAGRTLTELSIHGNTGFKAQDANACSVYVANGGDVITWSIQTMNPAGLPDLCSITTQLALLTQDRVN